MLGLIKLRDGLSTEAGLSEFQYEGYQYFLKKNDIYWNLTPAISLAGSYQQGSNLPISHKQTP